MSYQVNATNQLMIKQQNILTVFDLIREHGGLSRSRISKMLSLSPSTVTCIIDELKTRGFVVETNVYEDNKGSVGRRAFAVDIKPSDNYVLGIEAYPEEVFGVVYDLKNNPVTTYCESFDGLVKSLPDALETAVRHLTGKVSGKKIWGVGFAFDSFGGFIDYRENAVTFSLPPQPGRRIDFNKFSQQLGMPVYISEGATLSGMAERPLLEHESHTFLYLSLTKGICGSVVQNRKVLEGAYGPMTEFGHISIDKFGRRCSCGNFGCLEMYAANPALSGYLRQAMRQGKSSRFAAEAAKEDTDILWSKIVAESLDGDEASIAAVDMLCMALAAGVASLVNIFNPDTVVLGGNAQQYGERFLLNLRAEVGRRTITQYEKQLSIVYSRQEKSSSAGGMAQIVYTREKRNILFSWRST